MSDIVLNSLLRLSNQLTPRRETFPLPTHTWRANLRHSNPPINLSTYYLLDKSCSSSPSRPSKILTPYASTSAISPAKQPVSSIIPKKVSCDPSTEPSRRITEPENEIKKFIEKEKTSKNIKKNQLRSFDLSDKKHQRRNRVAKKGGEEVESLKREIEKLKEELAKRNERIRELQEQRE